MAATMVAVTAVMLVPLWAAKRVVYSVESLDPKLERKMVEKWAWNTAELKGSE